MRILHVMPAIAPRYGGPSQAAVELCRALQFKGVTAEICTTDADGPGRLPVALGTPVVYRGATCHFFHANFSESFKFSRAMSRWLGENVSRYDVLHIHGVFVHSTYCAAHFAHRRGVPYIVRPLGMLEPWSMSQKPVRKRVAWELFFRRAVRGATFVHYTTEQERKWTEDSLQLRHGVVVPNGVDDRLLEFRASGRFRKVTGIPADAPLLLALSRLHPKKGIEVLLRVFTKLKALDQLQNWHLVIAGDGDPAYVEELKRIASGAAAHDFVHWPGWLDETAKLDALAEANLFVLSSYQENFGISAVEAMACGTPVLLSRQVGLSPEVLAKRAGWIVDLDEDGLSRGLTEACRDVSELSTRGAAALALVRERFTWTRIAGEWVGLYESLISIKKEPALSSEHVVNYG